MLKKCLSSILILMMLLSIVANVPFSASTGEVLDNGTYQYVINTADDPEEPATVRIIKYLKDDEDVVIPSVIDGCDVTAIGDSAFYDRSGKALKTVVIPDTVTVIDNYAFYKCANLETVTMSDALEYLGYSAFRDCTALTAITLPATFSTVNTDSTWEPFTGCSSLKTVTVESGDPHRRRRLHRYGG